VMLPTITIGLRVSLIIQILNQFQPGCTTLVAFLLLRLARETRLAFPKASL
jgi:hypothetical protein